MRGLLALLIFTCTGFYSFLDSPPPYQVIGDYPNDLSALALLGWVELTGGSVGSKHEKKAIAHFEQVCCGSVLVWFFVRVLCPQHSNSL